MGRSDLADTPGEVGPVARHEGSRSTAQGASLAEDGVVEDVAWPGLEGPAIGLPQNISKPASC